jgi:hypothetical protein
MKLSARSINCLCQIVTGDGGVSPYRTGPELVNLFNEHGANDYYGSGFPSRRQYAEDHLRRLNDSPALAALMRDVLDPHNFLDSGLDQQTACDVLNGHLEFDSFEVVLVDGIPRIRDLKGSDVEFRHPFEGSEDDGHIFIDEQVEKANDKIRTGDYDGAITNARSLVEAVLQELERELIGANEPYDGDLPKLYKRLQKQLNLDPGRKDIEGPLKQVLSGLVSIVSGIAGVSNKMGDRHVRTYKPGKRHAVLVVNAAKTLANFLFETQRAQHGQPS